MGLLLSVLVFTVGVVEALSCYRRVQAGIVYPVQQKDKEQPQTTDNFSSGFEVSLSEDQSDSSTEVEDSALSVSLTLSDESVIVAEAKRCPIQREDDAADDLSEFGDDLEIEAVEDTHKKDVQRHDLEEELVVRDASFKASNHQEVSNDLLPSHSNNELDYTIDQNNIQSGQTLLSAPNTNVLTNNVGDDGSFISSGVEYANRFLEESISLADNIHIQTNRRKLHRSVSDPSFDERIITGRLQLYTNSMSMDDSMNDRSILRKKDKSAPKKKVRFNLDTVQVCFDKDTANEESDSLTTSFIVKSRLPLLFQEIKSGNSSENKKIDDISGGSSSSQAFDLSDDESQSSTLSDLPSLSDLEAALRIELSKLKKIEKFSKLDSESSRVPVNKEVKLSENIPYSNLTEQDSQELTLLNRISESDNLIKDESMLYQLVYKILEKILSANKSDDDLVFEDKNRDLGLNNDHLSKADYSGNKCFKEEIGFSSQEAFLNQVLPSIGSDNKNINENQILYDSLLKNNEEVSVYDDVKKDNENDSDDRIYQSTTSSGVLDHMLLSSELADSNVQQVLKNTVKSSVFSNDVEHNNSNPQIFKDHINPVLGVKLSSSDSTVPDLNEKMYLDYSVETKVDYDSTASGLKLKDKESFSPVISNHVVLGSQEEINLLANIANKSVEVKDEPKQSESITSDNLKDDSILKSPKKANGISIETVVQDHEQSIISDSSNDSNELKKRCLASDTAQNYSVFTEGGKKPENIFSSAQQEVKSDSVKAKELNSLLKSNTNEISPLPHSSEEVKTQKKVLVDDLQSSQVSLEKDRDNSFEGQAQLAEEKHSKNISIGEEEFQIHGKIDKFALTNNQENIKVFMNQENGNLNETNVNSTVMDMKKLDEVQKGINQLLINLQEDESPEISQDNLSERKIQSTEPGSSKPGTSFDNRRAPVRRGAVKSKHVFDRSNSSEQTKPKTPRRMEVSRRNHFEEASGTESEEEWHIEEVNDGIESDSETVLASPSTSHEKKYHNTLTEKTNPEKAFWLIFSGEYTKAMSKDWHSSHFCCWQCDESLTGQRYVLRDDHPYCIKCYESVFANSCEECSRVIGIDSKDLSYKDKHWHEACFLCSKCRVSLVDKQFGSKADKIYCGNCYDAQFASRCDGCGQIFRAGTKKMEYKTRQWHEQCFCCCVCKTPIGTKSFIPREQEIYCATCYEEKFATRCVKCNKIITSGGVTYKNEPWHRECFTCTNCSTSLAGQRFTSREDKPYCADCFGELFAKRCTACCKPITGIGGTRFISFEDRHWHNDCFICASCKTSLVGRGFITDGEDIICPECAKQKLM